MAFREKSYIYNAEVADESIFPSGMHRIALAVEYNGSHLHGFQAQRSGVPTVGQALEQALSRITNEPIKTVCAGRTDAGVHATGQIIHFDTHAVRPERAWLMGANTYLPDDISIRWATEVSPLFHARFSALDRSYRYIIHTHKAPSALLKHLVTRYRFGLSVEKMNQAAQLLVGEHDFSAYRASQCQARNPVRTIKNISFAQKDDFIVMEITANAFLYHMVRNIVGVLMRIGSGDMPVSWAQEVLASQDRKCADKTAPAEGLYLVNVEYEKHFQLPELNWGPAIVSGLF